MKIMDWWLLVQRVLRVLCETFELLYLPFLQPGMQFRACVEADDSRHFSVFCR